MATFTALNLEPEDEVEEEIDDTKEIQLEDAFKLYQTGLKLHSQGPRYYGEALEAYRQLFKSEIFHYPEAISEFQRDGLNDDIEGSTRSRELVPIALASADVEESSQSSLPQLVYLAYKNRGQFFLDVAQCLPARDTESKQQALAEQFSSSGKALNDFAAALERDDTDLDLWRKAARVAEVLATRRTVRFCNESVLAGDNEESAESVDLAGLDEVFAANELKEVLVDLDDDLSQLQAVIAPPKLSLVPLLKHRLDPYPSLPSGKDHYLQLNERKSPLAFKPVRQLLCPPEKTWLAIGTTLLQALVSQQQDTMELSPGVAIFIDLPRTSADGAPDLHCQSSTSATRDHSEHLVTDSHVVVRGNNLANDFEDANETADADDGSLVPPARQAEGQTQEADNGDGSRTEASGPEDDPAKQVEIESTVLTLPPRKRSSALAGNDEAGEAGRIKSKRIRARESNADTIVHKEDTTPFLAQHIQDQLQDLSFADEWMFGVIDPLLAKTGLAQLETLLSMKSLYTHHPNSEIQTEKSAQSSDGSVMLDFKEALNSWADEMGHAVLQGHGEIEMGPGKGGLTLFLENSKFKSQKTTIKAAPDHGKGINEFVSANNNNWTNIHDVALHWLEALIRPTSFAPKGLSNEWARDRCGTGAYMTHKWSDEIKQTVVQLLIKEDEFVYQVVQDRLLNQKKHALKLQYEDLPLYDQPSIETAVMIQSIFELHLDIYSLITNPSSKVDQATRIEQRDRLGRWADLAGTALNHYVNCGLSLETDDILVLRFIWASTTYANMAENAVPEHVMTCLNDLFYLIERAGRPKITLPNNAVMPEISIEAVNQEISRLSTLDFFMGVFNTTSENPVNVIESLEPLLEPSLDNPDRTDAETSMPRLERLRTFLDAGDVSLKLFLWKRLRDAYQEIDYPPKVVSCLLRAIETIMEELNAMRHLDADASKRQISMLKWLKDIDDLINKLIKRIRNEPNAFECIDELHLRSSITATARYARLLHVFAIFEDSVQLGQVSSPSLKSVSSTRTYEKAKDKFRDMYVRSQIVQYLLLKEAIAQTPQSFPDSSDVLAGYLRCVHHAMGIRNYCKYASKGFLKLAKFELTSLNTDENYAADMAQVCLDLYGLKFAQGIGDSSHGCPPEPFDRKTALQMADLLLFHANGMNIKDLVKSELKVTIDKISQVLGSPKSDPALSHNRRTISAFLKSPINPLDLYRSVEGLGNLATKVVHNETARIAGKGWYFLLGNIALTRYKSVKRVNQTPTDDLDIAASFFRHDLDHGAENWETWYHLAQVFDAKLEDAILWTSEKLDSNRSELATLQRNAIHAYAMASTVLLRSVDDRQDTLLRSSEMYTEFAIRLYASSRPPLSMGAFKLDNYERHYSSGIDQKMYKAPPFSPMRMHSVWNLASYLLRQALIHKPKYWINYYMLGKCLWKMFCTSPLDGGRGSVKAADVVKAFVQAVNTSPERRDSRNDPVLEPHFKLVSIVHKLVRREELTPVQGSRALSATPYARSVHLSEDEEGYDWDSYALEILRKLEHADKSHWHHRIISRAAHVLYDDHRSMAGALGAKHELTQQIFTKTMTVQVWKPEHERVGRHFVYTSRYVSFFVQLLSHLNDRANLDLLIRRIRRKPTEYLNHQQLWEEVTITYMEMLRRAGKVQEGLEKIVFEHLDYDEFNRRTSKLEKWTQDPYTCSTVLDVLRDAIELKKLNNSLLKGPLIDDLIADTYAKLYEEFSAQLSPEETVKLEPGVLLSSERGNIQYQPPGPGPTSTYGHDRMSLGNLLQITQSDGPPEVGPSVIPQPLGLGLHSKEIIMEVVNPVSVTTAPCAGVTRPPRTKQISRREIQRKAEGVVVRPPPIKTPILSKKPVIEIPWSNTERSRKASISLNLEAKINNGGGTRTEDPNNEAEISAQSSRRGSVHDSADDESELSDVDVERGEAVKVAISKLTFPNLVPNNAIERADEGEEHYRSAVTSETDEERPTLDRGDVDEMMVDERLQEGENGSQSKGDLWHDALAEQGTKENEPEVPIHDTTGQI